MAKEVVLTGIRANNDLHIGNYFGALLPMVDMAKARSDQYTVQLFLPDLHSFTTPIDHSQLQDQIKQTLRLFVAAGLPLDNPSIHIYRQSYVPAHSELTWILDCFTSFGEMRRMTQFKEKAHMLHGGGEEVASVGVFNYPVLMAADMLLYNAKYVPVGDDQTQHLEYTRNIGERLNQRFNQQLFVVPEPILKQHEFFGKDQGLRIRDLTDPTKKMSKSEASGKGTIFLTDIPEKAAQKIMGATTDSMAKIAFDWQKQPGVTNLLQILALLSETLQGEINSRWASQTSYGELKKATAEAIKTFLSDFQAKLAQVDEAKLMQKLGADEEAMNKIANQTLRKVQAAVGLRPRSNNAQV